MRKKTVIPLAVLLGLMLLPLTAGVIVRNIILRQVKGQVEANFQFSRMKLSFFPPMLVIQDIRSKPGAPNFSARSASLSVPLSALLSSERRVSLVLDRPVFRVSEAARTSEKPLQVELPFAVDRGVIHEGEFHYRGRVRFRAGGVNAFFTWGKDDFRVQARCRETVVFLPGLEQPLTGTFQVSLEGGKGPVRVTRLVASGPSLYLKAAGDIQAASRTSLSFAGEFNLRASWLAEYLRLPFDWGGEVRGSGRIRVRDGRLSLRTDLDSRSLTINQVPLGAVRGRVDVPEEGEGIISAATVSASGSRQTLRLSFRGSRLEGQAENLALDPILREISLPWPVRSPAWGRFVLEGKHLEVEAEFRDEILQPGQDPDRFALRGPFNLAWDGSRRVRFGSPELDSSFAKMKVEADLDVGRTFDLRLSGQVKDVRQARRFTSLILDEEFNFPEVRGSGNAEVVVAGPFDSPRVRLKYFLFPGALDRLEASFVEGTADIDTSTGRVLVSCRADDPQLMGQAEVEVGDDGWSVRTKLSRGRVERLFPALDIPLALQGPGTGEFVIVEKDDRVKVTGDFASPELHLAGQSFTEVKGRVIFEEDESLHFPLLEMSYRGGRLNGSGRWGMADDSYDLDLAGSGLDLGTFDPGLRGRTSLELKGSGRLGRDAARGRLDVQGPGYGGISAERATGEAELLFSPERVEASWKGFVRPGENDFSVTFAYRVPEVSYAVDLKGAFTELDLLLPWRGAKGRLNYLAEVRSGSSGPEIKGVVDFQGPVLPIPEFSQAANDYSGLVFIEGGRITLRSFQATLGGSPVQGTGELFLEPGGGLNMDFSVEGKGLQVSPLERTRALADGNLRLIKDSEQFVLDGDFLIHSLSWRRDLSEAFIFSSDPYYETSTERGFFDGLTLNLRLRAEDNAWVENSLGRVRTRFDLTVTGSVDDPILLGEIELLGGYVLFQDRKFNLLRGNLRFFNPTAIDPYLDFRGETYVKDYRVTFSLSGLLDHLRPEFTSSPALPPEDVLALLAMGEAFKRTYRSETSAQLSSASLLTFQLSEEAKKRATKLLSVDRFQIDPFILGSSSEMTARLTVGKKITRNLFIYYSTNLTTQREEIVRMEWELGDNLSLVGLRDELGRLSFDFKVRKRF